MNPLHNFTTGAIVRILVLLIGLVYFCPSHAQAIQRKKSPSSVNVQISYLEDKSGALTYEELNSKKFINNFVKFDAADSDINFGFSDSTYWLRLSVNISNGENNNWVLEIPYLGLKSIELYGYSGNQLALQQDISPLFYRFNAFPIVLAQSTTTYYLRIQSSDSLSVPIRFWSEAEFLKMTTLDTLLQGAYFGSILGLFLYNLIIGIFLKDKGYLLYVLYLVMIGLGVFSGNGYGHLLLWSVYDVWNSVSQSVFFGLGAACIFLFARNFLSTPIAYPRLDKIFISFSWLYLSISVLLTLSTIFAIPHQWLLQANLLASIPAAFILIATTVHAWLYGQISARFFLLGWGALSLGVLIAVFRAFNWIPTNVFTSYAVQISTALEMMLFSFALADRVQSERKALIASQGETLKAKQELVDTLLIAESKLEKEVLIRTSELRDSLDFQMGIHEQYIKFVSMISHEFRNPLNIIEAQSALICREGQAGASKITERMRVISNAVHRVAMLFDKWLQNDRLNSELDALHLSQIELKSWLEDLVNEARLYHGRHTIEIESSDAPILIYADDQLLKLAVLNLIDNACKYSPKGSNVKVAIHEKPGQVGISVQDQGIGIAPENKHAIFTEYFRGNYSDSVKGMGLGLPFVKRIMNLHKGDVNFNSATNEGSCFYLWLPMMPGEVYRQLTGN